MLLPNRTLRFSSAIRRKLIHGTSNFNIEKEEQPESTEKFEHFQKTKLSNLEHSSIKPFLNTEKMKLIKKYYITNKYFHDSPSFVINEDVAKDIVETVLGHDKNRQVLVENNPGLGLMTINLIRSGIHHIVVYDQSELADVSLNQIKSLYKKRIVIKDSKIYNQFDAIILGAFDDSKLFNAPVTFLGVFLGVRFFRQLSLSVIRYALWKRKFKFYFIVSTPLLNAFNTSGGMHRYFNFFHHCLFNNLFLVEKLGKYPRDAFLPLSKYDTEDMNLIKVCFNPDFLKCIKEDEVKNFWIFLNVICKVKKNYVIPTLEAWLPDCGPYLISKGIAMTTQCKELTHQEITLLFTFIKKFEGYEEFKVFGSKYSDLPGNKVSIQF